MEQTIMGKLTSLADNYVYKPDFLAKNTKERIYFLFSAN